MKTAYGVEVLPVVIEDPGGLVNDVGGSLQIVRAACIEAVVHAAVLSVRAFERSTNRAKTPGGELLLRLAGTLQIRDAIREVGLAKGPGYLVVFGGSAEEARRRLGLRPWEGEHCPGEKLKPLLERAAMVEVL
ncbi:KEOPS complex subunit Cgi121 [Thermococcus sp.]|uniref:KEOPS complex subunit Cgi121 n=1 Tax=Thermococcus sp. TaxID=35749 RepID=UPI002636ACCB|nr:KEOPS complex subunit Cgi121 [Thermococcus sp.]